MSIRYVECPRDAWQGLARVIPTDVKIAFLQQLLDAGFKHLDMGSFVSLKAVPQLADTEQVLAGLKPPEGADLLCIMANERGLERALDALHVSSVGYPLSVNETFQRRNTNRSLADSWPLVREMARATKQARLGFVVYLSMGFGNPYGEAWEPSDTATAVRRLRALSINQIVLADTVGTATPKRLKAVLEAIEQPETLGLHLHSRPNAWQEQLELALDYGIGWFEGALGGIGGCPFAADVLVGNLPTEHVLPFLQEKTGVSLLGSKLLQNLSAAAQKLALGA